MYKQPLKNADLDINNRKFAYYTLHLYGWMLDKGF